MIWNNLRKYALVNFGSVLVSLFTLFALSVTVSAQDAPNYLLGNLTLDSDLTTNQIQEVGDEITNYTNTMLKEANGNITKLNVLLIEDMAKRNIIDEEAKEGFLSFVSSLPAGNLTTGNVTDSVKDLNTSSALLDEIAKNNSDSETVTLMSEILKNGITDIGNVVSGNVTDTGLPPMTILSESDEANLLVTCGLIAGIAYGPGLAIAGVSICHSVVLLEEHFS